MMRRGEREHELRRDVRDGCEHELEDAERDCGDAGAPW